MLKPTKPRRVLLTGSTGGLGQVLLKNFAEANIPTINLGRNQDKFENTLDKMNLNPSDHIFFEADFSSQNWISSLHNFIIAKQLVPDTLINCAGINTPIGPSDRITISEWKRHFEINFFTPVELIRIFLKLRNPNEPGWIFNISGGGATKPMPYFSPYAASKTALIRFTENLAHEIKHEKLLINAIAPGFLNTEIHKDSLKSDSLLPNEYKQEIMNNINLGGQDPNKTYEIIMTIIEKANFGFSGNLISSIWDNLNDDVYSTDLLNSSTFKLRRIEK